MIVLKTIKAWKKKECPPVKHLQVIDFIAAAKTQNAPEQYVAGAREKTPLKPSGMEYVASLN